MLHMGNTDPLQHRERTFTYIGSVGEIFDIEQLYGNQTLNKLPNTYLREHKSRQLL